MKKWSRPKLAGVTLVFNLAQNGHLDDLRSGIRLYLTQFYPQGVALRMSAVINFNYHYSRDHQPKFILLTADGSTFTEAILLDLYARMSQQRKQIHTSVATYAVRLEGNVDVNELQALCWHYFWLDGLFQRFGGGDNEWYQLN